MDPLAVFLPAMRVEKAWYHTSSCQWPITGRRKGADRQHIEPLETHWEGIMGNPNYKQSKWRRLTSSGKTTKAAVERHQRKGGCTCKSVSQNNHYSSGHTTAIHATRESSRSSFSNHPVCLGPHRAAASVPLGPIIAATNEGATIRLRPRCACARRQFSSWVCTAAYSAISSLVSDSRDVDRRHRRPAQSRRRRSQPASRSRSSRCRV